MALSDQQPAAKPADFFPAMLRIAVDLDCDIQMDSSSSDTFTANCPFHPPVPNAKRRTMTIHSETALFACSLCGARGNPYAFAARAWGVTANDAHLLLLHNGQHVTAARPPYPQPPQDQKNSRYMPNVSNTAVMTRALAHYRNNLLASYEAIRYLVKLAVDPQDAAKANLGFSTGTGLREHLAASGITEEEMATTPLFDPDTGLETFQGRLVLADTDFTGGCIWLTSLGVEEGQSREPWRHGRPPIYGIPALKPDLLNLYSISPRTKTAVITDDARLYILLAAQQAPVALITQKRRQNTAVDARADRYARSILRRNPRRAALLMHDRELMAHLRAALTGQKPNFRVHAATGEAITSQLDPATRDTARMFKFPAPPRPHPDHQKKEGRHKAGPQAATSNGVNPHPVHPDPSPPESPPQEPVAASMPSNPGTE